MQIAFKEEQKFSQWWLWLILTSLGILPFVGIYKQFIVGEPFGDKPIPNTGLIILSVVIFLMVGLFLVMRLQTTIDATGIEMRYFPFLKKKICWHEIKTAKVINYGFVGGWGIRLWTDYGTVYNVKGNKGVAIQLTNGKKLLIGTQKEAELKQVIENVIEKGFLKT